MLVVDGHTLQAIHLLNFIHEMLLQFLRSADIQNFVRNHGTFSQLLAFAHKVTFKHDDVLTDRNHVFFLGIRRRILDHHRAFTAHTGSKINDTVDP